MSLISSAALLAHLTTPTPVDAAMAEGSRNPAAETETTTGTLGYLSESDVRMVNHRWSGIGFGYDNGLWGSHYGQSLKVSVPFGKKLGRFMGLRVRAVFAHHNDEFTNQFDPVVNVGGELFGRSPVWNGTLRVYGGGGLWAGIRPNPTEFGNKTALGGGGHFGVEVMAVPFMSFTFEIGGQAPGHDLGHDGGASAMGGLMFYFGRPE